MIPTKKATIGNIIMIVIILLSAVCLLPIFSLNYIRLVQMISSSILFIWVINHMKMTKLTRKIGLGLILFYTLILGYYAIGYSDAGIGNYFYQILFFIFISATVYLFSHATQKNNIFIYYILLVFTSIHFFRDIIIGQTYVGYTIKELTEFGSQVDSTSFSTLSLIILCISLLVFLNTKNKFIKIIHLFLIALNFYYIVFCGQRGSVVMLMLIAVFFIIYEKFFHKQSSSKVATYLFFGVLLILVFFLGEDFVKLLIRISPNERLTERFMDMQGTMQQGVSEDSFSGRLSLEIVSINSWLGNFKTFLLGIGDHRLEGEFGSQGFAMSGIGGHSELIDSLARYGIVGFSIIASLYYNICKYILTFFNDTSVRNQVRSILVTSVIIALTKGLFFPEIGLGLFLLLPLSSWILNKNK